MALVFHRVGGFSVFVSSIPHASHWSANRLNHWKKPFHRSDLVSIRKRLLRLPAATRVIWMSQPPVIDGKGEKITNHKLQRINDAADAVFRSFFLSSYWSVVSRIDTTPTLVDRLWHFGSRDTGVLIWDSHLSTAEENLRACLENPAASDNQWYCVLFLFFFFQSSLDQRRPTRIPRSVHLVFFNLVLLGFT